MGVIVLRWRLFFGARHPPHQGLGGAADNQPTSQKSLCLSELKAPTP
jgi:hypothetical protein